MMSQANQGELPVVAGLNGGALVRLFDSLFVLRPTLMFPLFTMVLAGYRLTPVRNSLEPLRWGLLSIALCSLFGLVYLINQMSDRESDAHNNKLFFVAGGTLSRRHLMVEAALLAVVSPVALATAGFSRLALWVLVMFVLAGLAYNLKPVALARHPFGGVAAGLLGGWLLLRCGGAVAGGAGSFGNEFPYVIAFGSSCLLTELLDADGDAVSGKRTFTVVFGRRRTILAALIGFALTTAVGIWRAEWVVVAAATVALPLLLIGLFKRQIEPAVQANKFAILALSLLVGVDFPFYLAAIFIYYLFARWYYRRRFGMDYPSLKGA
jgi:1,4-dihydroxy-2-naphthoate octaprenyltransferase